MMFEAEQKHGRTIRAFISDCRHALGRASDLVKLSPGQFLGVMVSRYMFLGFLEADKHFRDLWLNEDLQF